jgi:nucleoporin NUP159
VRFNKAKTDQGFARMLKSRTLGPDHVEMQTQLRRDIRVGESLFVMHT